MHIKDESQTVSKWRVVSNCSHMCAWRHTLRLTRFIKCTAENRKLLHNWEKIKEAGEVKRYNAVMNDEELKYINQLKRKA